MPKRFRTIIDNNKSILDHTTGELSIYKKIICETPEEFIKIYLNCIEDLVQLDRRMFQILMVCLREAKFCDEKSKEGNILYNFADFKDKCRKHVDNELSDKAINMYMSRLASQKLLLRRGRGTFILNPLYFAKGRITDETRWQLLVEYNGK